MSRDWQKDMERVENFKHVDKLCNGIRPMFHGMFEMPEPDILVLEYWLQQYAVWKAKAYEAEVKAHEAESREKKLREGIEKAMDHIGRGNYNRAFYCLEEVFYPEEGTK